MSLCCNYDGTQKSYITWQRLLGCRGEEHWIKCLTKETHADLLLLLQSHRGRPDVGRSNTKSTYLPQSLAAASWGKMMSGMGREQVLQASWLENAMAPVPQLRCWAAAAGRTEMGCRPVWLWHYTSLLRPQGSRCRPARSVPGHGACCLSDCHLYSTPGWIHCDRHSLKNWWWWLRRDENGKMI